MNPSISRRLASIGLAACTAVLAPASVQADEGMWTVDHFPSAAVSAKYGFTPDEQWLTRVQASAVRLTNGCSASVVSRDGLVLTNHHCVVECVQSVSTPERDLVSEGFVARRREDERPCPGMQAEILIRITDVSDEVLAAIKAASTSDIVKVRDAAMVAIEDRGCRGETQFRCEVVSLYQGGQYKLYRYRIYSDVRLVFSPEFAISFFGGDPDNFNFPRYCLDSAFVRLYENGRPVAASEHLTWRRTAPAAGELVFVAGNPGSTSRLETIPQLQMTRDWLIPIRQLVRSELRGRLIDYSDRGLEQMRTANDELFFVENSFKAYYGQARALVDADLFARKAREERALRSKVEANAELAAATGDPLAEISAAIQRYQDIFLLHDFLERRAGSISRLFQYGRSLVRAGAERQKPSADRLPEYSDSKLELLRKELLDARPIYPGVERLGLSLWLSKTREYLTVDNPLVTNLLGKRSPEELASDLVAGTRLADSNEREALWRGGQAAIDASHDPLIRFVRATDTDARAIRKRYEQDVEGPITRAAERIAHARFKIYGETVYPDATFTLRISYGTVDGWVEHGETVPPLTVVGGLYARATDAPPFRLPVRWTSAQKKLDPQTPLNASTTNDIIGGNSGSPLIDKEGRVAGAIFDSNIHALGGDFGYDPRNNRAIAVLTPAIGAALRHVYEAPALADELESQSK